MHTKYYIYMSKTKCDMLLKQCGCLQTGFTEMMKFGKNAAINGIPLFSFQKDGGTEISKQYEQMNDAVDLIIQTLDQQNILSFDGTKEYIQNKTLLNWVYHPSGLEEGVCWCGQLYGNQQERIYILLMGSAKNLIGAYHGEGNPSFCSMPIAYRNLMNLGNIEHVSAETLAQKVREHLPDHEDEVFSLEFGAKIFKRLTFTKQHPNWQMISGGEKDVTICHFLICSPIYLALADEGASHIYVQNGRNVLKISQKDYEDIVGLETEEYHARLKTKKGLKRIAFLSRYGAIGENHLNRNFVDGLLSLLYRSNLFFEGDEMYRRIADEVQHLGYSNVADLISDQADDEESQNIASILRICKEYFLLDS